MRLPGKTMREVCADAGRFPRQAKEIRLASGAAFRGKAQLCDGTMARSHLEEVRADCWRKLGVDAIEVSQDLFENLAGLGLRRLVDELRNHLVDAVMRVDDVALCFAPRSHGHPCPFCHSIDGAGESIKQLQGLSRQSVLEPI